MPENRNVLSPFSTKPARFLFGITEFVSGNYGIVFLPKVDYNGTVRETKLISIKTSI
jgi:hypothetical protein